VDCAAEEKIVRVLAVTIVKAVIVFTFVATYHIQGLGCGRERRIQGHRNDFPGGGLYESWRIIWR